MSSKADTHLALLGWGITALQMAALMKMAFVAFALFTVGQFGLLIASNLPTTKELREEESED